MSLQIRLDGIMDPDGKYPNPLTGQPYSKQYFHNAKRVENGIVKGWTIFKPWLDRIEIFKKIHKYNILLTIIPPGTGKTVILPKLLIHYFGYQRPVVCTTPRQVTTSGAGEFSAQCLDVPLFHTDDKGVYIVNPAITNKYEENRYDTGLRIVGYKYSGKNMSTANTLLLFTTDGTVKKMLLSGDDPNLSKYGGVIIDEAHERSVNIDIVIALLLDVIKRRPDFKVIIMSATIDENLFTNYFKKVGLGNAYSVYKVPALQPLYKRIYEPELKQINPQQFTDVIFNKINKIILDPNLPVGDILAFVTSDPETQKLKKRVENNLKNYPVNNKPFAIAFSAQISDNDKSIATQKGSLKTDVKPNAMAPQGYSRKVIIATNAVESSVTFGDDLKYVIDAGLAFEKNYDAKNYCYITGKFYVSKASIEQRCGRTGRTCDGTCIQLYTTPQFKTFDDFTDPKILVEDFTKELLGIICLPMNGNLQKGLDFINRMIQEPKSYQTAIYRAYNNLVNMDFIDTAGNLLPLGRVCNSFNKFDIKIGKMCIGAYYLGCMREAIFLGAILSTVMSVEDIFQKPLNMDEDPALERAYIENIKRQKNDYGDHITLLQLYINYAYAPNPRAYAEKTGLNIITLNNIEKSYKNLLKEIENIMIDIKNLNLFNVPQEILAFGGGRNTTYNNNTDYQSEMDNEVDSEMDNEIDNEVDSEMDSEMDSDVEMGAFEKQFIPNEATLNSMYGGYFDLRFSKDMLESFNNLIGSNTSRTNHIRTNNIRTNHKNKDKEYRKIEDNQFDIYFDNGTNSETGIQDYITNNGTIQGDSPNDGGIGINSVGGGNKHKTKKNIQKNRKGRGKTHKQLMSNNTHKPNLSQSNKPSMPSMPSITMVGGNLDKELEKKIKRNQKIIDLVSLKGLKQGKTMYPPTDYAQKILCALFFGFSNNIASYSGVGKKYTVKYSPLKGGIGKSVFDYNNRKPDFLIYNEFIVSKLSGRPDDAKLNIVSEITANQFAQFIDINEIRKQL